MQPSGKIGSGLEELFARSSSVQKHLIYGARGPQGAYSRYFTNSTRSLNLTDVRVGFHSPMPPARTGVADYSASLLTALRAFGTVELSPARADVHLYHIANNVIHRDIYSRALAQPGVVVLHDALLQHLFMGTLDETGYA